MSLLQQLAICLYLLPATALAQTAIVNLEGLPPGSQVFVDGVSVFPVPTTMHAGIPVDVSSLPSGDLGYSTDRVRPTTEIAPPSGPAGSFGAFRTVCTFAKTAFDDPITAYGQPGVQHLHTFFGNRDVNAFSTALSIAGSGNSTCRGGTVNRTSYWFPTMVDLKRGNKAIVPRQFLVYYKGGDFRPAGSTDGWTDKTKTPPAFVPFQPPPNAGTPNEGKLVQLPEGLRMVAGDPSATAPHPNEFSLRYKCVGGPKNQNAFYGPTIPQCDVGADMTMEVFFPPCWDGVNLDSPNHKSHMAYPVSVFNKNDPRGWSHVECPKTHPVALPQVAYQIDYLTTEPDQKWRLSSDAYAPTLPDGYSGHGDWFNGWKKDVMKAWLDNCLNPVPPATTGKDCHGHLLGDGRELF